MRQQLHVRCGRLTFDQQRPQLAVSDRCWRQKGAGHVTLTAQSADRIDAVAALAPASELQLRAGESRGGLAAAAAGALLE